jgi:hypothetical protein
LAANPWREPGAAYSAHANRVVDGRGVELEE